MRTILEKAMTISSRYRLSMMLMICLMMFLGQGAYAEVEGFYKDLFMDGGVHLTSRTTLPAADTMGLSWEYLATESVPYQNGVLIGDEDDSNGRLLYPDGASRFRILYTNGGQSSSHGQSLGEEGRERIREFYYGGGSYTGTCAGAFISSEGSAGDSNSYYYHIWPGWVEGTGLAGDGYYTGHFIPPLSPLLSYSEFGGDNYIDDVYHWGGCYAIENFGMPAGTEILLRYDYPGWTMHNKVSCWAYQTNDTTGRLVVIGSHPEGDADGEPLQLMSAMIQYALDGVPGPRLKGELISDEPRIMDLSFEDEDPAYTMIGDLQYHHYSYEVPEEAGCFTVTLNAEDDYDFHLFADPDSFAFAGSAESALTGGGSDHYFVVADPEPGTWYISVKCASTVNSSGQLYYGDLSILNGAAYTITASWDTQDLTSVSGNVTPESFVLYQNFPNPFNPNTTIRYRTSKTEEIKLTIYDVTGRLVSTLYHGIHTAGYHEIDWSGVDMDGNEVQAGIYFCSMEARDHSNTIRMLILR